MDIKEALPVDTHVWQVRSFVFKSSQKGDLKNL
jgi:hypothetical protein